MCTVVKNKGEGGKEDKKEATRENSRVTRKQHLHHSPRYQQDIQICPLLLPLNFLRHIVFSSQCLNCSSLHFEVPFFLQGSTCWLARPRGKDAPFIWSLANEKISRPCRSVMFLNSNMRGIIHKPFVQLCS